MKDASSSLAYHEATRHSEVSLRASGHYLGWTNKPSVFKIYWNLPSISLPCSFPHHQEPVLKVMRGEIGQQGQRKCLIAGLSGRGDRVALEITRRGNPEG